MFPSPDASVAARLRAVQSRIEAAVAVAGRPSGAVTLVAVSKTHPAAAVEAALEAGQMVFGENRVQEAGGKFAGLRPGWPGLRLHLIGGLQTNKARDAVRVADVIESLDRPRLADAIAEAMQKEGRAPSLLVQVNVGDEVQKAGVPTAEADSFIETCQARFGAALRGLMCIPPGRQGPGAAFRLVGGPGGRTWADGAEHGDVCRLRGRDPARGHARAGGQRDLRVAAHAGVARAYVGRACVGVGCGTMPAPPSGPGWRDRPGARVRAERPTNADENPAGGRLTATPTAGPAGGDRRPLRAAAVLGVLGVVYGDIGTSPLYALKASLTHFTAPGVSRAEVLGVLSLIAWALVLTVTIKYVLLVMRADNNGEGGILALMAVAQRGCRDERFRTFLGLVGIAGPACSSATGSSRRRSRCCRRSRGWRSCRRSSSGSCCRSRWW